MSKPFYRFCVFNGIGAVLLFWAYKLGYLNMIYEADTSRLTAFITLLFIATLVRMGYNLIRSKPLAYVDQVRNWLETLGLIGTVIGFPIALSGIDISALTNAGSAQGSVTQFLTGISVACYTTLVGAVCSLWLDKLRAVCK